MLFLYRQRRSGGLRLLLSRLSKGVGPRPGLFSTTLLRTAPDVGARGFSPHSHQAKPVLSTHRAWHGGLDLTPQPSSRQSRYSRLFRRGGAARLLLIPLQGAAVRQVWTAPGIMARSSGRPLNWPNKIHPRQCPGLGRKSQTGRFSAFQPPSAFSPQNPIV